MKSIEVSDFQVINWMEARWNSYYCKNYL